MEFQLCRAKVFCPEAVARATYAVVAAVARVAWAVEMAVAMAIVIVRDLQYCPSTLSFAEEGNTDRPAFVPCRSILTDGPRVAVSTKQKDVRSSRIY